MSTQSQAVPQQITYKIVYVRNIDETITSNEISKLLGFHRTPHLRKNTCVEIIEEENEDRYAKVVCPDYVQEEVVKMNGIEYYNKKLVIENEDDADDATTSSQSNSHGNIEADDDEILYVLLDCRNHPDLNFPRVLEYEVCDALNVDFAEDVHKAVNTGRGMQIGTFRIESEDLQQYVGKTLTIRNHPIELIPIRKRKEAEQKRRNFDPNGVKVRIFDAWSLPFKSIDHQAFDEYFTKRGIDIIRPTQPERCRERRNVFNTNRYIVVRNTDENGQKIDLGERIEVADKSFNISYFGKLHYCGLCKMKHGWQCASQVHHDFLRKMRKGKTNKCKIYSDSTLRLINQLALTTDVACMSGGGVGQLCNVIPFDAPHDEVIINAGTNEMNCADLHEFAFTVEKEKEKIANLATQQPVTLVLPEISTDIPEMTVKGKFMAKSFQEVEGINVINLQSIETDDHRGHPSAQGTVDIIKQIHTAKNIIMKDCLEDVLSPQIYRGVQSLFKTGCRGCNKLEFTPFLCTECREKAKLIDTSEIEADIKKLKDELFPPISETPSNGIKRSREEDIGNGHNDDPKKPAKSS